LFSHSLFSPSLCTERGYCLVSPSANQTTLGADSALPKFRARMSVARLLLHCNELRRFVGAAPCKARTADVLGSPLCGGLELCSLSSERESPRHSPRLRISSLSRLVIGELDDTRRILCSAEVPSTNVRGAFTPLLRVATIRRSSAMPDQSCCPLCGARPANELLRHEWVSNPCPLSRLIALSHARSIILHCFRCSLLLITELIVLSSLCSAQRLHCTRHERRGEKTA
jgi:hypothetical protein